MKDIVLLIVGIYIFTCCNNRTSYDPERTYKSIEKALAAKFMLAKDSTVIELDEGHFIFKNSLILEGKKYITIKGEGIDKTVLSFKIQESGAEGLRIANCEKIVLEGFAIEDAAGDNIKVTNTDGIVFRNLKSAWTGEVSEDNGAYGLYPVLCNDVIVENCEVMGASDAGIYVGQSTNVSIKNNVVYWNVAGIESENSANVVIEGNEAYENTGGILIFDLPGLTMYGNNIKAFNNHVHNNNLENFAPPGNIVGFVPPGTGFLVLATRDVEIYENIVEDNKTLGAGIVSYELVNALRNDDYSENRTTGAQGIDRNYRKDVDYDPYPGNVHIRDNSFSNSFLFPDLNNEIGKLLLVKFWFKSPQIAWDGIRAPEYMLKSGKINPSYRICVTEGNEVKIAILDAANNFEELTTDPSHLSCEI